jgi:regulatory protein
MRSVRNKSHRIPPEPPGAQLDPEGEKSFPAARLAAVALLGRRDLASTELRERLNAQGFAAEDAERVVAELIVGKIVNDARYAENYVAYHAERGQGPERIGAALKALDLPESLIEGALAAGPDWRQRAREVRIRRFGLAEPETDAQRAKQGRFLQYRGFSADHIRAALGPDFDLDA